jgi:hypothetical protein
MSKQRNKNGQFRKKRGDTKMGSIENEYGVDFGVRSDKKLENYLDDEGLSSLSEAVKKAKNL